VSEGTGVAIVSRRRRRAQRVEPPATRVVGFAPAEGFADWPDTVRGELALSREVGQSFVLMGLMAVVLTLFVGLGLLAVRMLV
jgi:hypothetical protein